MTWSHGPSWEEGTVQGLWGSRGPAGQDWGGSPFMCHVPGTGCSGMLPRAGSCRCSNRAATSTGTKQGVALDVPGPAGGSCPLPLPSRPVPSGFALEQGLVLPPPCSTGYLRGLVGHHHALPSRHRVVHILGQVVAFHADEVAGGGCLACGGNLASGGRDVRDPRLMPAGAAAQGGPGPPADGGAALTVIEVTAELVVGAAFHHLGDVLCLLVDGHGPDDGAWRRGGGHLDLDGTCFCNLAVEFLQQGGVLEKKRCPWGECHWV